MYRHDAYIAGNAGQVISSNHDTYLISADSAEMADSWVAAIRRVMHEVSWYEYVCVFCCVCVFV